MTPLEDKLVKALEEIRATLTKANNQPMYGTEMDAAIQEAIQSAEAVLREAREQHDPHDNKLWARKGEL